MRAPHAILGIATLLWGFVQAPFFHIHPEDLDEHPSATPAHMHVLSGLAAHHPILDANITDDDAVDVEWGIARASVVSVSVDFGTPETVLIPAPTLVSLAVHAPQQRGHDPPEFTSTQSRAPPV